MESIVSVHEEEESEEKVDHQEIKSKLDAYLTATKSTEVQI